MKRVFRWVITCVLIVIALGYFFGDDKDSNSASSVGSSSDSAKSASHAKKYSQHLH